MDLGFALIFTVSRCELIGSCFCNGLEGGNHLGKLNAVELILHVMVHAIFYRQFFILEAGILLEYYGFTMLFQGNYYMYFQRTQGMYMWCYL